MLAFLTQRARDPLGRVGTAVAFTVSIDTQTQLIFTLHTGRVIAVRDVSLGRRPADPPRGTVLIWRAVSNVSVVRSDRQLPG
ncbi:MAG TPA: hypothetical protein VGF70_14700 [Solirubrobacteraceae bacterium]